MVLQVEKQQLPRVVELPRCVSLLWALISRAERGGWVAEQKAAGFGVLVVVFGSGGGEKGGFLRAARLGKLLE